MKEIALTLLALLVLLGMLPNWKGAGILVLVIWFFSFFAVDRLAKAMFGSSSVSSDLCHLIGNCLAAILTLGFALLIRKQRELKLDPETGKEVEVPVAHSLCFIPVIAWPVIIFGLGIVNYSRGPGTAPAFIDVNLKPSAKLKQPASTLVGAERIKAANEAAHQKEDSIRHMKELKRKLKDDMDKLKEAMRKFADTNGKE